MLSLTKKLLLNKCKDLGIKNYSSKNKAQLIELLKINNIDVKNNIGSNTAKNGLNEELFIVDILNNDKNLQNQLSKFVNKNITNNAYKINGTKKSDINISNINIQHKKTKKNQFGQLDRHYVEDLIDKIPQLSKCKYILQNLCELPINTITSLCDKNYKITKINNINYTDHEINNLIQLFENNKRNILEYAFYGNDISYKPELLSITLYNNNKRDKLIIWKLTDVIDYLMTFNVNIKKSKTVIEISNGLTFQRKGGDCGAKQANNFQIKFIPTMLPLTNALVYKL